MQPPTYLQRIDTERNVQRFYFLRIERTLFGNFALLRQWGRIGTRGRRTSEFFDAVADAEIAMAKTCAQKRKRGYR